MAEWLWQILSGRANLMGSLLSVTAGQTLLPEKTKLHAPWEYGKIPAPPSSRVIECLPVGRWPWWFWIFLHSLGGRAWIIWGSWWVRWGWRRHYPSMRSRHIDPQLQTQKESRPSASWLFSHQPNGSLSLSRHQPPCSLIPLHSPGGQSNLSPSSHTYTLYFPPLQNFSSNCTFSQCLGSAWYSQKKKDLINQFILSINE